MTLAAVAAAGDTPDPHDSAASMGAYFARHRTDFLNAAPAGYVGAAAIAGFVLVLAAELRAVDQHMAAVVTVISGLAAAAYLVFLQVAYTSIAFNVGAAGTAAAALFLPTILAVPAWGAAVGSMLLTVAYAAWKTRLFPRWYSCVSLLGGLLSLLALAGHANSGYLYPDVQQQYVVNVLLLWLLVTAITGWVRGFAGAQSRVIQ